MTTAGRTGALAEQGTNQMTNPISDLEITFAVQSKDGPRKPWKHVQSFATKDGAFDFIDECECAGAVWVTRVVAICDGEVLWPVN